MEGRLEDNGQSGGGSGRSGGGSIFLANALRLTSPGASTDPLRAPRSWANGCSEGDVRVRSHRGSSHRTGSGRCGPAGTLGSHVSEMLLISTAAATSRVATRSGGTSLPARACLVVIAASGQGQPRAADPRGCHAGSFACDRLSDWLSREGAAGAYPEGTNWVD